MSAPEQHVLDVVEQLNANARKAIVEGNAYHVATTRVLVRHKLITHPTRNWSKALGKHYIFRRTDLGTAVAKEISRQWLRKFEPPASPDATSSPTTPGKLARPVAEIRFYRADGKPYGVFSNLLRRSMTFEGREYPTAEHAYQAGKAARPEVRAWLLAAPTPALCAIAAHGLPSWDVVSDWTTIKLERMRAVLRAKFEQHPDLAILLADTGDARLVEAGTTNNAVNRFWGEVGGKGQNMLGVMLMELRTDLRDPHRRPRDVDASERSEVAAPQPGSLGTSGDKPDVVRCRLVEVGDDEGGVRLVVSHISLEGARRIAGRLYRSIGIDVGGSSAVADEQQQPSAAQGKATT